jgi:ATP-binding cassette subfamily B protein
MSPDELGLREEEFQDKRINFSLWRRLLRFALVYRKSVVQLCAANILLAIGESLFPLLTRYAIDVFARTNETSHLFLFVGLALGLAVFLCLCTYVFIRRAGRIENYVSYDIRRNCFDRLQMLSFSYFDKTPVGYIMARMTSDSVRLSETLAWSLVDILWAIARIVSAHRNAVLKRTHYAVRLDCHPAFGALHDVFPKAHFPHPASGSNHPHLTEEGQGLPYPFHK